MDSGVIVDRQHFYFQCLFVGDLTMLYSLMGMPGAAGKFPFPWCKCSLVDMDSNFDELTTHDFSHRPLLENYSRDSSGSKWQKV